MRDLLNGKGRRVPVDFSWWAFAAGVGVGAILDGFWRMGML